MNTRIQIQTSFPRIMQENISPFTPLSQSVLLDRSRDSADGLDIAQEHNGIEFHANPSPISHNTLIEGEYKQSPHYEGLCSSHRKLVYYSFTNFSCIR